MLYQIIIDIFSFLVIFFVAILAFAIGFYVSLPRDTTNSFAKTHGSFIEAFLTYYFTSLDSTMVDPGSNEMDNVSVAKVLMVLFAFFTVVVLLRVVHDGPHQVQRLAANVWNGSSGSGMGANIVA